MLAFTPLAASAIADNGPFTAVQVSGVSATGAVGTVIFHVTVDVGGVSASTAVGSVSVTTGTGTSVNVTGLSATSAYGIPTVTGDAIVPTAGLEATASVGVVTQRTTAVIPISLTPGMIGSVGSVDVTGTAVANLTGVSASGLPGAVLVWGRIIPGPATVWTEIIAA